MKPWIQNVAIDEAKKSTFPRFRHSALITKGGRIISKGVNVPKPRTPNGSFSSHAEIFPLKRLITILTRQGRHEKFDLYVVRLNQNDDTALSKPCDKCMRAIHESGIIDTIHYTTNTGWESIRI